MSDLRLQQNDDKSYSIKNGKWGRELKYTPGGNWRENKNFLKAAERDGWDIPEDRWQRKKYFENLDREISKSSKYNKDSIDTSKFRI